MNNRGFTLLEMLVSLAIFTIAAVFAVGSLVRITALNRQAQTLQSSMNNLGFALEAMSREMRVGTDYYCDTGPGGSGITPGSWTFSGSLPAGHTCSINLGNPVATAILFTTADVDPNAPTCNLINAYWFIPSSNPQYPNTWSLQKAEQSSCGQPFSKSSFHAVLDENNTHLTGFSAAVYQDPPSQGYSFVYLRLSGYAGTRLQDQNSFNIQTSISQRITD
ncbi:MAG: type II secretion system protein [Patescibacteria group bacterium]|nr:type II secretion system protein [Patescibacteria group bacterium]MDE2172387.1 type II secretion system protein [Patescibacteria group bacterium]